MPLSAGTKLGSYEILALIGAGGMGEVWKARDTKLDRDVAIKVLPTAVAQDAERLARFEREAKVLASLNHANIATIHGVAESDNARALVMELVEGYSPKGPLPFDEAWKIASQIIAALEYAHERGIMHRDLKPANIIITPEGAVKLLDFGLAKAFSNQREPSASPENSPTLTLGATDMGVILADRRWMAYASDESGAFQIYVWAFPDKGGKWQVSNDGGLYPVFSRNGRDLFFRTDDNRIMVASYTAKGDSFIADKLRVWPERRVANLGNGGKYDVSPDGKRIAGLMRNDGPEDQRTQNHVIFLENFFDEVRRRAPTEGK